MKSNPANFSKKYEVALRAHLQLGTPGSQKLAEKLGLQALAAGLKMLDLAKLHEQTLVNIFLPGYPSNKRTSMVRQAGIFFASTILFIKRPEQDEGKTSTHLKKSIEALSRRTVELAAANQKLSKEVAQREIVEKAFRESELNSAKALRESDILKEQLRRLSRLILSAQEDERKKISRELHDVIAQALIGINVHLATLKKEAALNTKGWARNISVTQRLVNRSASIVHEFARELRPPVLDDLGLIPALQTFMETFKVRTGIQVHLTTFAGVENFDISRRTVLFRVAQEALTNVARHAHASRVEVTIKRLKSFTRMEIHDNGKSFQVDRMLEKCGKRLGLLGMRERVEMVGGAFCIESTPKTGTTVQVDMPFSKAKKGSLKKSGNVSLKCHEAD